MPDCHSLLLYGLANTLAQLAVHQVLHSRTLGSSNMQVLTWVSMPGQNSHALAQHWMKTYENYTLPSFTRFSLKRLLRIRPDMFPLAKRIPVSIASLLRSDSVNPFKNSSNCKEIKKKCQETAAVVHTRDATNNHFDIWITQLNLEINQLSELWISELPNAHLSKGF